MNTFFRIVVIITMSSFMLACGGKKTTKGDDAKIDEPPPKTALENTKPAFDASKITFKSPGTILKKAYGDWKLASAPRYFGPENLYDLINGGAEVFVSYGFKQIVTVDYKHPKLDSVTVTVEVYDMATPLGAFGRLSKYLENLALPKDAGKGLPEAIANQGIYGDGDTLFWKDKFIVHLTLMDENPEATPESIVNTSNETLPVLAKDIFDTIQANPSIEELPLFPEEFKVARSETYYMEKLADVLGSGFTCRYQKGDNEWSLFISSKIEDNAKLKAFEQAVQNNPEIQLKKTVNQRIVGIISKTPSEEAKVHLDQLTQNLTK